MEAADRDVAGVGQMGLRIDDYPVVFPQNKVVLWNQHFVFSLDQNDESLVGNIRIPDGLSVPCVSAGQMNFNEMYVSFPGAFTDALDAGIRVRLLPTGERGIM